tara:strand:- start:281 stop:472 length:192 start_codon:yes stop_codon:yes gene_type:complete
MTVNEFYQACVDIMKVLGNWTNTTYEEINIIVFLVINPMAVVILLAISIYQRGKIKGLKDCTP